MTARPVDIAPLRPVLLPDSGLQRGWETTVLLGVTFFLLSFGLVTLYSTSSVLALRQNLPDTYFVLRQAGGAGVGLLALGACAWMPYTWWKHLAWPLMWLSVVCLVILILPGTEAIAPEINGARRWLRLGVAVQPSEFAKIAMVMWTASMAVKKLDQFQSLSRGLGPFFVMWTVMLVPVAMEPDLSTAILLALLGMIVIFAAGARLAHFLFLGLLALPVLKGQLAVGFRAERIASFLNPASDPSGAGFQAHQSLVALGSGGITGVGIGEGRQKFGFLPEAHNDFIFAMVGEEWGLLGVLFLVALYLTLILVGFRIASRAPDLFGELLAVGLTSLIALQAVLHMAVGLALVPTTGLALPLVSYGRSNLIVIMVALGVLMSIARHSRGGKGARA
ncbi:MAG: putative lipid II flippase FtsW [Gemmatimonadota bacterium]|nr:putative lipid II flippase FtsW [Gemmatimonadota bacterium]MDH5758357.1 putative lipid II flippase FtsW [Gemmatimonadota bacterium]